MIDSSLFKNPHKFTTQSMIKSLIWTLNQQFTAKRVIKELSTPLLLQKQIKNLWSNHKLIYIMEQVSGIEPPSNPWQGLVLTVELHLHREY